MLTDEEAGWRKLVEEEVRGGQHCYLKLDGKGRVDGGAAIHHGTVGDLLTDNEGLNCFIAAGYVPG